jgi:hypothetical protein
MDEGFVIAIHEAGHAIILTEMNITFSEIRVRGQPAVDWKRHTPRISTSEEDLKLDRRELHVDVAGRLSEERYFLSTPYRKCFPDRPIRISVQVRENNPPFEQGSDADTAKKTAWGIRKGVIFEGSPSEQDILSEIVEVEGEVAAILERRWNDVITLASALQGSESGQMSGEELCNLLS